MDDRKSQSTAPTPVEGPPGARVPPPTDKATRLAILSIENTTLLAHRSQIWNEAASRGTAYLAVLSGAVVAIALAAQATAFGQGFLVFALLLLPVVLYAGLVTLGRIAELNNEDLHIVQALNRVQHGLLELDPGVVPYLASSPHDDWIGMSPAFGAREELSAREEIAHGLKTLPALFSVINGAVAAVLAAAICLELGLIPVLVLGAGVLVFVGLFFLQLRFGLGSIESVRASVVPYFPTPSAAVDQPHPEA